MPTPRLNPLELACCSAVRSHGIRTLGMNPAVPQARGRAAECSHRPRSRPGRPRRARTSASLPWRAKDGFLAASQPRFRCQEACSGESSPNRSMPANEPFGLVCQGAGVGPQTRDSAHSGNRNSPIRYFGVPSRALLSVGPAISVTRTMGSIDPSATAVVVDKPHTSEFVHGESADRE